MNNGNKAIASRINKELRIRNWSQSELLKRIIKFKNPEITSADLYKEVQRKKGNFSVTLKGGEDRSINKEDLYIISKIFCVPLEYLWFGENKKENFIPSGARYVAYQDSENEYRAYMASLDREDAVQIEDEFGFNLFDYFGQFNSINGYKFFLKNYNLHFDYNQYGELVYVDSNNYKQLCRTRDKDSLVSDNLIMILAENNDVKAFKQIFFDHCSLERFNQNKIYHNKMSLYSDYFLDTLLKKNLFFDTILKIVELDVSIFHANYGKNTKRLFVEPMFYDALSFALRHDEVYIEQLTKMLQFALEFNKKQYKFIKDYLNSQCGNDEHADCEIDQYAPRFLLSSRNIPMGNIFQIQEKTQNNNLSKIIKEIEKYSFDMMHIINPQEKNSEEIMISTPKNPLFLELNNKAKEQHARFVPIILCSDKEFTYFKYYESNKINFNNPEQLKLVIQYLDQAQNLVTSKPNKVLVHGNLESKCLMSENNKHVGLSEWQNCYYGNKYQDRAVLLSNIQIHYLRNDYPKKYRELFDIIAQGFNATERRKLFDVAIEILNKKRKEIAIGDEHNLMNIFLLKEKASNLELLQEILLSN